MIRKIVKRLSATNTWTETTDLTPIDIPRDGLITEVSIRADLTATLTAAAYDDWFRRCFQNIKIEGDGGRAYLGMSGAQMSTILSLWNEVISGAPTICSNGAGIALSAPDVGSTTFKSIFRFHPGSDPHNPFDTTAVIPAAFLSMLQAKLSTPVDHVTDAAGPITAGTVRYSVNVVQGSTQELRSLAKMSPVGSTLVYAHTANYSDYSYDIDVPAGAWLRSIIMRHTDDTGTPAFRRKSDEVTGVKLKTPKMGDYVFELPIFELQHAMCQRYGLRGVAGDVGPLGAIADLGPRPESLQSMVPAGFEVIDLRPFGHPIYGLDLTQYQTGDLKLGLTIENYAANDATTIYWDQLLPL